MPESAVGTGDRSHCLGLSDRAKQCLPHRHLLEGRVQMVDRPLLDEDLSTIHSAKGQE